VIALLDGPPHDRASHRIAPHVVSINDALFHVGQHGLPFGGIGESGVGHYHGREGFETFAKPGPIFHQARFSSVGPLAPP
jgi:coniferyl-aldehyde dehydrogenase